ncbi:pyrroloquinoline quinone biosynthesis protein PqqF [Pseudomonas chlororaphis]|uniref:pyrroloquinoline quinone biosynthesis protein PqqF n=1 Tax=Pseudomonas chlororaphis TaxID=587753 RepID=UPI0003D35276|nr:pyrroloquinoline quinone biosynthesis protein PqqF [Pseudomonas chlororaphis]AZD32213.1 Coenzyme PQQ synthesis protein F [Pseudomonas chlororaphis]ETD36368.1 coenzyme PQQ biosynthesis protein F [Pseudomonas chlororaphis subsp. aurantiaca PB-St2]QFS57508.1 pyrroloquinoline quinone biosynthesis protein PqqF [Pseudomonas chlororaphis subsp. aurantiaca]
MPALNHPLPHQETLANGLRVSLHHVPRLKRCAAALRVSAGSHDVPPAWPGLAHFLEHLLFLGTERFPAEQGLMAYVQRHGGQVNASTGERHTDFFFELPAADFAAGLERLADMLAHPRMSQEDQLREREVLHAEFIAWSRDAAAQRQFALLDGLSAEHPLRAFHAGNRYSLNVPRPAFQQALRAFYQAYYHSGQMSLSLAGPQSREELKALAESFGAALAVAEAQPQDAPVPLLTSAQQHYQQLEGNHLNLLLACERLPTAGREALDFLCTWLASGKPGGLLATLKERKLVEGLKAAPLYQFAGQALLHIQFDLTEQGAQQPEQVSELFFDWLAFFSSQDDWPALRDEYALLQQRKRQVASALALARLNNEQLEPQLSDHGVTALKALLSQLQTPRAASGGVHWQLPAPNPFLRSSAPAARAGLIRGQTSAHRGLRTFAQDRLRQRRESSAMTFSQAIADDTGEAALYLRWRLQSVLPQELRNRLQNHLRNLRDDGLQAGVELSFSVSGNQCLLTLKGLPEPMPAMLQQALLELSQPDAAFWQMSPAVPTPLLPIRQLLQELPERCLGIPASQAPHPLDEQGWQTLWEDARWDGLAIGLGHAQSAIGAALGKAPGTADSQLSAPPSIAAQQHWHELATGSGEQALLLFCPAPGSTLQQEASWRLLGQLGQMPFYQRLRVELQLGYAVFSGVRQINGQTGLLFGVQSPSASLGEILEHIQAFLARLPELIEALDDSSLDDLKANLAAQFDARALPVAQLAELLWQGRLAGHPSDYLEQLQQEMMAATRPQLLLAAEQLQQAQGGWRCLASGACPGEPWQAAK